MHRSLVVAAALLVPVTVSGQERGTITGVVVDSVSGQPVEGVSLYLNSGPQTATGRDGRFELRGAPRSGGVLRLRRVGYAPRGVRLGLLSGTDNDLKLSLTPLVFALDTIEVEARMIAQNPNLADFYRRRHGGMGHYFTRAEIWKQNPLTVTEVVQRTAGVRCGTGGCTGRVGGFGGGCRMQVVLDGMPTDLALDMIPPGWVAGIEVYRGPATTPLEFGRPGRGGQGSQCGTIVIWTGVDDR